MTWLPAKEFIVRIRSGELPEDGGKRMSEKMPRHLGLLTVPVRSVNGDPCTSCVS